MKNIKLNALSTGASGLFVTVALVFGTTSAQAQDAPGLGSSLTGKVKEAGAVGIGTAADETAKGADVNTAVSKGSSAALNHGLGAAPAAPAVPAVPGVPAVPDVPAVPAASADAAAPAAPAASSSVAEAGAVGVKTAADEAASGADMKAAAAKGGSAALSHGLGAVAPAVPATPPAE